MQKNDKSIGTLLYLMDQHQQISATCIWNFSISAHKTEELI